MFCLAQLDKLPTSFVCISLEEVDKLLDTTGSSLRRHHRTLTRVRQIVKMIQRRQRVSAFVSEFMDETRVSVVHVERLMKQIRGTKRFLTQLLKITFGPLGGQVVIEPRANHREDRVNKREARDKEYEEYVEDADCTVLDCL